jgi:hypothetical protein
LGHFPQFRNGLTVGDCTPSCPKIDNVHRWPVSLAPGDKTAANLFVGINPKLPLVGRILLALVKRASAYKKAFAGRFQPASISGHKPRQVNSRFDFLNFGHWLWPFFFAGKFA